MEGVGFLARSEVNHEIPGRKGVGYTAVATLGSFVQNWKHISIHKQFDLPKEHTYKTKIVEKEAS